MNGNEMFPSADMIAVAIYAAARELVPSERIGEFALATAHGKKDVGKKPAFAGGFPLARIRIMAAAALWEVFPEASRTAIGERLGQGYADVWASNLGRNLKSGAITWLDDDAHERVRDAIVWAIERAAIPVDLPGFIPAKKSPAPMGRARG